MKKENKFIVAIEETIAQEFEIIAESADDAMRIAKEQYEQGIIVLESGEVQSRQMAIVKPENEATQWSGY